MSIRFEMGVSHFSANIHIRPLSHQSQRVPIEFIGNRLGVGVPHKYNKSSKMESKGDDTERDFKRLRSSDPGEW